MNVFAFPSREVGLGSSVLDAMALGVPVVASTAGRLPELIGRDERGLLVSVSDPAAWDAAIRRVLADEALRSQLIQTAQKFARHNDVVAMATQYLAFYHSILSNRRQDFNWIENNLENRR